MVIYIILGVAISLIVSIFAPYPGIYLSLFTALSLILAWISLSDFRVKNGSEKRLEKNNGTVNRKKITFEKR